MAAARPATATPAARLGVSSLAFSGQETATKRLFERITSEISKIYVGQEELVLGSLVALFSSGHVLIESVPGLGKTLFVRTLGRALGCQFGRIQFTADLMPSDITGAPIFDMKLQEFRFRPGPVFTQLLLADEINRSPAKTHAALLEIMQEYRVTIDGKSHELQRPFLVLATQNPIESEGTYNLPEAQLDRFMFKLVADYPPAVEEAKILDLHSRQIDVNERLQNDVQPVTTPEEIMQITRENGSIRVDSRLIDYINSLVRLTRKWPQFHMGASPRAGIALMQGARTLAAFAGRDYAVPDDVVQIALPAPAPPRHSDRRGRSRRPQRERVADGVGAFGRSPAYVTGLAMGPWLIWIQENAALLRSLPWLLLALFLAPLAALAYGRRTFPHTPLALVMLGPCLLSLGLVGRPEIFLLVATADVAILLVAIADLLSVPGPRAFSAERTTLRIASLQKRHPVTLTVNNHSRRALHVRIRDDLAEQLEALPDDFARHLPGRSRTTLHYEIRAARRGSFTLRTVYLEARSRFGLWKRYLNYPVESTLHVYPDMQQLSEYAILARTNRLSLMGVRRVRKVGQDNDFERLRDYTRDDNYKHIDWRTTALGATS